MESDNRGELDADLLPYPSPLMMYVGDNVVLVQPHGPAHAIDVGSSDQDKMGYDASKEVETLTVNLNTGAVQLFPAGSEIIDDWDTYCCSAWHRPPLQGCDKGAGSCLRPCA